MPSLNPGSTSALVQIEDLFIFQEHSQILSRLKLESIWSAVAHKDRQISLLVHCVQFDVYMCIYIAVN